MLTIVDTFSRFSPVLEPRFSFRGADVVEVLERIGRALPVRKLHEVPESVSDRAAIFVEPVAAAVEILEQVHVRPSQDVFVLGDRALAYGVA